MNRTALAVALAGVVLLAGCSAPLGTATAAEAESGATTVVTTGSGSVTADADLAVLSLSVVAVADTADAARSDAATRSNALVEALLDAGVEEAAITTAGYSLTTRYDDGEPRGYRAVHAYRVETTPDAAGSTIDAAVDASGVEVWGVSFTLSADRRAELRAEAVANAVADARADADAAAAAAGLTVTGVDHVEVGSAGPVFPNRVLESADAGTTLRPGPVTVDATVTVSYHAE